MSSRYLMLNRGSYCLIQVYSSWSDSSSLRTTVQSTDAAVRTIVWVRKCKDAGSAKYEFNRCRRFFALPTYKTVPAASRKR